MWLKAMRKLWLPTRVALPGLVPRWMVTYSRMQVVVADDGVALFAGKGVILGVVAHDGPEADEVVRPDGGVGADVGVGQDAGAGADGAGAVNDDPRPHLNVGRQFHPGGDLGAGVNGHRGPSPGQVPGDSNISETCTCS